MDRLLPHRIAARIGSTPGDIALALVLTTVGQLDAWLGSEWSGLRLGNAAAMLLAGLALAWRRTRPHEALAVVVCAMVVQSITVATSESPVELFIVLVAAYSTAAHADNLVITLTLLAVGIAAHDLTDPKIKTFGDAAYDSTIVALAVLLGIATRRRQGRMRAAERTAREHVARQGEIAAAAAAEERRRIARELHDIVSHSLGIVVLQAGAADQIFDRDAEQARAALRLIRATGLEAINEMTRMLEVMRGEQVTERSPQPSLADLDTLVARAAEAGLDVAVTVEGERRALSAAVDLSAYRIVQEALTNVMKHAPTAATQVLIRYADEEVLVEVLNDPVLRIPGSSSSAVNGTGDDAADGRLPSGGRGLHGMRERVAIFGGRFEVGPRPDGRWQLTAALPVA